MTQSKKRERVERKFIRLSEHFKSANGEFLSWEQCAVPGRDPDVLLAAHRLGHLLTMDFPAPPFTGQPHPPVQEAFNSIGKHEPLKTFSEFSDEILALVMVRTFLASLRIQLSPVHAITVHDKEIFPLNEFSMQWSQHILAVKIGGTTP